MDHMMRILIGYDGSDCAEAALDDLQRAGLPDEVQALVLSVAEFHSQSASAVVDQISQTISGRSHNESPTTEKTPLAQSEGLAARACRRIQNNFPKWNVKPEALPGSPASELIHRATRWNADLLVVGSHGHTGIRRLVLGSVSQRVLAEAGCTVRVARGRVEEPDAPVRVLIGVDASPLSELAVREVARRKWPEKSEARLVVIDDPLVPTSLAQIIPGLGETIVEENQIDQEWVRKLLHDRAGLLRESNLKVSTLVKNGDAHHGLVKAAEEWGADCVFLGSAGFTNRLERLVLGSVSAGVAAHAHCSIEVVRNKPVS
jgi:nucleotide-binding universal stress UspA family protein